MFKPFIPSTGVHLTRDLLKKPITPLSRKELTLNHYEEYLMNSIFDPQALLNATIDTPMTKRNLVPAGQDYIGTIGEPKPRKWTKKDDPSISGVAIDLTIEVDPNDLTPAQK